MHVGPNYYDDKIYSEPVRQSICHYECVCVCVGEGGAGVQLPAMISYSIFPQRTMCLCVAKMSCKLLLFIFV